MLRLLPAFLCLFIGSILAARGDQPVPNHAWSAADIHTAMSVLAAAGKDGLDPDRYSVTVGADEAALTGAVLAYMRDLSTGRPDLQGLDADIGLPQHALDAEALLSDALKTGRMVPMLVSLAPSHPGYLALKAELAREPDVGRRDILAANMERWRWLPGRLEPDRIEVNAAAAELTLWLGGKDVLSSRVIVGKPRTRTPILRAEGAGITVNPAWNVPHSIAVKEILPKLKRNPAWLKSQDMMLLNGPAGDPYGLSVDWRAIPAGSFPYRLRQAPGAKNPLGQVKLELPNRFDVYLHDTPGKAAFGRGNRALSHGCVRVEQILPLASYALTAGPDAMAQIQDAIGQGQTRTLPLQRKLPVYILYWTAFAGRDGKIQYVRDLYGRDKRLIAAMHRQTLRVAALAPGCKV